MNPYEWFWRTSTGNSCRLARSFHGQSLGMFQDLRASRRKGGGDEAGFPEGRRKLTSLWPRVTRRPGCAGTGGLSRAIVAQPVEPVLTRLRARERSRSRANPFNQSKLVLTRQGHAVLYPSVGGTRLERERRGRFLASAASMSNEPCRASHKTDRSRGCN
jgi:hypothetical protein